MLARGEFARARVLAEQLPANSRTVRRLEPRAEWDEKAYLLALIADNIAFSRYEQRGGKGHKPEPVKRPRAATKQVHKHLEVSDRRIESLLFGSRS